MFALARTARRMEDMDTVPAASRSRTRLALLARTSYVTTLVSALLSAALLLTQVDIFLLNRPPLQLGAIASAALKATATAGTALGVLSATVSFILRRINIRLARAKQKREKVARVAGGLADRLQGAPEQVYRLSTGQGCAFPITLGVLGVSIVVATITFTPSQQIALVINNPISSTPMSLPQGAIKSFPIPTAASAPVGIAAGRDGNLWFTERDGNKIAKITPAGAITEYPLPTPGAHPTDIAAGPDGAIWFDEATANTIGRITSTGTITEFAVPSDGLQLTGVTGGPDGAIWFCKSSSTTGINKIDKMTLAGKITEHILSTAGPNTGVSHIHPGPDHNLWFTGFDGIERVTPSSAITDFLPDTNRIIPLDITTGPDGNLWFTDIRDRAVGRSTPAGAITLFPITEFPITDPSHLSASNAITAGSDGNLWFTYSGGIRRITPVGAITEFALPAPSTPVGIAAGSDGGVWFTERDGNKIGMLAP
jgi:virginiamycin B lyase